ncbi:MAG: DNA-processing protein DprA [Verrucomicrobiota bacterium]
MNTLSKRQALLALNSLPHVGPVTLRRLMDAYRGDAHQILESSVVDLKAVEGVGDKMAATIRAWSEFFNLEKEEGSLERNGARFIIQEDEAYPELLRETYDPPIGLYWKGKYEIDRPCIAIVGTRRGTLYGLSMARKFAGELARLGFCIVSGMARGTDTAAHEGALEAGGKTVAVLGCGLDIIYPPENLDLYRELAEKGAVMSEFPFGRRADRQTFPMRNRVVAGMCEAVIVIESDLAGGSMITARFAGEQGRTLMALPGRVDQRSSAGCHQLLRDGAILVRSVEDILEELRYQKPVMQELDFGGGSASGASVVGVSEEESALLACFAGGALLSPDALSELLKRPISEVSATLMALELKRRVVKRADGSFEAL